MGRKTAAPLQPARRGLLQGRSKALAMGLHVGVERRAHSRVGVEGALQVTVPVVAVQGPVEHHQTTR